MKVSFDGNFRGKLWQAWNGDAAAILRQIFAEADLRVRRPSRHRGGAGRKRRKAEGEHAVAEAAGHAFAAFPHLQWLASTMRMQHSVDRHTLSAVMAGRDGTRHRAPDYELEAIVDRIGTGDAFAAGVLHGLVDRHEAGRLLHFGLGAACLKHSLPGDFNLVAREEVAGAGIAGGIPCPSLSTQAGPHPSWIVPVLSQFDIKPRFGPALGYWRPPDRTGFCPSQVRPPEPIKG